jgi:hypothetical protein
MSLAYDKDIDLHFYISPIHARLMYSIDAIGLWEKFESWKRELIAVNRRFSRDHNGHQFPIWDFSDMSEYQRETVPAEGDTESRMQWYWESSHYKSSLGELILDRMFLGKKGPGIRLNDLEDIDEYLAGIKTRLRSWAASQPEDVEWINSTRDQIIATRGKAKVCPANR